MPHPSPPHPQEPLSNVYAWVRAMLAPAGSLELPSWYLYTTPPPTAVADSGDSSILEARLAPAALLFFGWGTGPSARMAPGVAVPSSARELMAPHASAAVVSSLDAPCALAPADGQGSSGTGAGDGGHASGAGTGVEAAFTSIKLVSATDGQADAGTDVDAMAASLMGGTGAARGGRLAPGPGPGSGPTRSGAGAGASDGPSTRPSSDKLPSWLKIGKK